MKRTLVVVFAIAGMMTLQGCGRTAETEDAAIKTVAKFLARHSLPQEAHDLVVRRLGTVSAKRFAATELARVTPHIGARIRYLDEDQLSRQFVVAARHPTSLEPRLGWRRHELLDHPRDLLAASPFTTRWLEPGPEGRSHARLLVETDQFLPSGFHLPVGAIVGSFDLSVAFTVLEADEFESAAHIYLGPSTVPSSDLQGSPEGWLRIQVLISGGATDSRVGAYLHALSVNHRQKGSVNASIHDWGWLPHRPYEVRVRADATAGSWEVDAHDLLSGARVLEGRIDNVVWPATGGAWAFGMYGRSKKPSIRLLLDRVTLDTQEPLSAAIPCSAPPEGWVAGGLLARGLLSADQIDSLLAEKPGDARRLADILYACLQNPSLAERGLGLVERLTAAIDASMPVDDLLSPEVAGSLARIRTAAMQAFVNRSALDPRPTAAASLKSLASRLSGEPQVCAYQQSLLTYLAAWLERAPPRLNR